MLFFVGVQLSRRVAIASRDRCLRASGCRGNDDAFAVPSGRLLTAALGPGDGVFAEGGEVVPEVVIMTCPSKWCCTGSGNAVCYALVDGDDGWR